MFPSWLLPVLVANIVVVVGGLGSLTLGSPVTVAGSTAGDIMSVRDNYNELNSSLNSRMRNTSIYQVGILTLTACVYF